MLFSRSSSYLSRFSLVHRSTINPPEIKAPTSPPHPELRVKIILEDSLEAIIESLSILNKSGKPFVLTIIEVKSPTYTTTLTAFDLE
jgi:hypothetical protein